MSNSLDPLMNIGGSYSSSSSSGRSSPTALMENDLVQMMEEDEDAMRKVRNKWEVKRNTGGFTIPSLHDSTTSIQSIQSLSSTTNIVSNNNTNNINPNNMYSASSVLNKNTISANSTPAMGVFKIPSNTNLPLSTTKAPSNKEYGEYLAKLQLRNREKKRLEEDPQKKELEERERGFSLNWSGANNQKKKDSKSFKPSPSEDIPEPTAKIRIRKNRPSGYAERNQSRVDENAKRGWKQGTVKIRKENGDVERIAPSRAKSIRPQMFESEDDRDDEFNDVHSHESNETQDRDKEEENDSDNIEDDDVLFRKKTRVTLNKNDIEVIRRSLSSMSNTEIIQKSDSTISTMDTLIEKLKKLDQQKQKYLLKVLEKLEKSDKKLEIDVSDDENDHTPIQLPKEDKLKSHSLKADNVTSTLEMDQYCIRILSTWGHSSNVGLTEIELYSYDATKIEVSEENVNVKGGLGGKGNIMRVFNGKKKTTNDQYMWQTSLPTLSYLEIVIDIPVTLPVVAMTFWNFNKSINESVKGVRELEILRNNEQLWRGTIQRGCGNNIFDYSTSVQLLSPEEMQVKRSLFIPPKLKPPTKISQMDETPPKASDVQPVLPQELNIDASVSDSESSDVTSYTLEVEDDDTVVQFNDPPAETDSTTESTTKNTLPIIPPLNIAAKENNCSPIVEKKENTSTSMTISEQQEPIWLSLSQSSPTPEKKAPKGNILSDALKITNPEKVPVWFRELDNKEKNRKKQDITLPEKSEEVEVKEPSPKEVPQPIRTSRSRGLIEIPKVVNTESNSPKIAPEKPLEPLKKIEVPTQAKRYQSRSKSRPKRPQVVYNSGCNVTEKSSISNETYDSLMRFKYSHLGRLKPREEESNIVISEPTEIQPPIWKIEKRRSSSNILEDKDAFYLPSLNIATNTKEEHDAAEEVDEDFIIPIYPSGQKITINILESWGDPHYLGLSGIEIFDKNGNLIALNDVFSQVKANPSDINALPEYSNDPRTVDKLFDGVNMTCDDLHQWLTPFTPGGDHFIYITLNEKTTLSMIRFWNYNKSRIHSYRGARYLEMYLDDKLIFKGEIKRSAGTLSSVESCSECILFTTEAEVLEKIEKYDQEVYGNFLLDPEPNITSTERPKTASKDSEDSTTFNPIEHFSNLDPSERPLTSAIQSRNDKTSSNGLVRGQKIRITLETSWGDLFYIGLTGIEVLGKEGKLIKLTTEQLSAKPRDMNEVSGHSGDYRTLDKLIDGCNITTDDRHMWMVPVTIYKERPYIEIDLRQTTEISGIRFFNYNKNLEDTFRGVKKISLAIDGKPLLDGEDSCFILKKAPGNTSFDFGHTIIFADVLDGGRSSPAEIQKPKDNSARGNPLRNSSLLNEGIQQAILKAQAMAQTQGVQAPRQDYQTALLPCAYTFKFHLISSHGDPYYVGLNGIELYDARHEKIPLASNNIHASPYSVSILEKSKDDVRTPDKLIDGVNNTWNDRHMWLAPVEPGQENYLYIIFEEPIAVSYIKIWNYSKTPSRGVEEVIIYADDVLIYKGFLRQAPAINEPNIDLKKDFAQSILFTNDPVVCTKEKKHIYSKTLEDQEVKYFNEKQLLKLPSQSSSQIVQSSTKNTSISRENYPSTRPTTSVINTK
ncbi:hypothetical protein C9374_011634 [Naegleria lovaniensis]|uniref:KATNIP domain-containing protein n=1 Tax=Naegleria lovaniensis TaxID=51637 RepID=A0AA88KEU2_NAELO|nr:uncharacterized protein C9374_011634 [Naegleria lovaniensis]KAG2373969.1 hypothetical protein C9374_011634 [Naegleria lovaniensis]